MRVGTKGKYAIVALVDVALNSEKSPAALAEVAQRQQISLSYLEQLFSMMRRSGLVIAYRGPGGGYRLQRPPGEIALAEVFNAVEDIPSSSEGGRDWLAGPASHVWEGLERHIVEFLEARTLADAMTGHPVPATAGRAPVGLSAEAKLS